MSLRKLTVLVILLLVAGLVGLWTYQNGKTYSIAIAAGPRTGQAFKLMTALQEVARRHHPNIRIDIYETRGSLENSQLMARGAVELATTQADLATAPDARMVAELYPDAYQLIVRPGSGIKSIGDLAGKAPGSAARRQR